MLGRLSPGWVRWCCRTARLHLCAPICALPAAALCQAPSPRVAQGGDTGGGCPCSSPCLLTVPIRCSQTSSPPLVNVVQFQKVSLVCWEEGGEEKKKKTIKKFKD